MNSFRYIYILTIFILFSQAKLTAQCSITDVTGAVLFCNGIDQFSVEIDFEVLNPSSEQFLLTANGINFGNFNYAELPITINNLIGDCITEYQFIIKDTANPACSNIYIQEPVCCNSGCQIRVTQFFNSPCNEDTESVNILMNLSHDGSISSFFDIFSEEGFFDSMSYDSLPVLINDFPVSEKQSATLIVCDHMTLCCDTLKFDNPCTCFINNAQSHIVNCDESTGSYHLLVDFDYNMTSDSFLLGYNTGVYGVYSYDTLPLTIGPFPFSNEEIEILMVDQFTTLCFDGVELGVIDDCDQSCSITDLSATIDDCNGDRFGLDVTFDSEFTTSADSFVLSINDLVIGTYNYGLDIYPIEVDISVCQSQDITLVIQDITSGGCADNFIVNNPLCCECPFTGFGASITCDSVPSLHYSFEINPELSSGSYTIAIDSVTYGPFLYTDTITSLEIADIQHGEHTVTIIDGGIGCQESILLIDSCEMDMPCFVGDLSYYYDSECIGDFVHLSIVLDNNMNTSDSFTVQIDSIGVGTYAYAHDSIILDPILLDCMDSTIVLSITDMVDVDCKTEVILQDIPCCESIPCEWTDLNVSATCIGVDSVRLTIQASMLDTTDSEFSLSIDGILYGVFEISEFPLEIDAFNSVSYDILLADTQDSDCLIATTWTNDCPDEDCLLQNPSWDIPRCLDLTFDVVLDLSYEFASDSFDLDGNGNHYGTFTYDDLPLTIENLMEGGGISYEFIFSDSGDSDCVLTLDVGIIDCITDGVDQLEESQFSVLVRSEYLIISHNVVHGSLSIYNTMGERVYRISELTSFIEVNTRDFTTGVYFVLLSDGHSTYVEKVFVP